MDKKDASILLSSLVFILLTKLVNPDSSFARSLFMCLIVIESYVFLAWYRKKGIVQFKLDLYNVLTIVFIHSCIGMALFLIGPNLFSLTKAFDYPYKTFFYLFYVTADVLNPGRNTGIFWEPGLLQLFLNIFLFLSIKLKKPTLLIALIVLAIISSGSTTGYICLSVNYFFYLVFYYKTHKQRVILLLIITLMLSGGVFFVWRNVQAKIGSDNTSGIARYRDYLIGMQLIQEKPLLGHGVFDAKYLLTKKFVGNIEADLFTSGYLETQGDLSGGYTNGLLQILAWFGIPMGLYMLYGLYKNQIVNNNKFERPLFFLIIVFSIISEPISGTPFFFIFVFSSFVRFQSVPNQQSKTNIS
ncbi:hypothetical protein GCM10028826_21450 [Mucilaginibacter boryungensis]